MTGTELKHWREAHNLSQSQMATLLAWSRDQVARRELGTSTMPDDVALQLNAVQAALLRPAAPPNKPSQSDMRRNDRRRYWDIRGREIAPAATLGQKPLYRFIRRDRDDMVDDVTGAPIANVYEVGRNQPMGGCTPVSIDLDTWMAHAHKMADMPNVQSELARINRGLQPKRDSLTTNGQPSAPIDQNPTDDLSPQSTAGPENFFDKAS